MRSPLRRMDVIGKTLDVVVVAIGVLDSDLDIDVIGRLLNIKNRFVDFLLTAIQVVNI